MTRQFQLEQIVMKTRQAIADGGTGVLSTGEALAAALVLNRSDWLASIGYTIPEAIDRIGPEWAGLLPEAARIVNATTYALAAVQEQERNESAVASLGDPHAGEIDVNAKLVTYGDAPGYRDANFVLDVTPLQSSNTVRLNILLKAADTETMCRHLLEVHRFAWRNEKPIDIEPNERKPAWIER